MIAIEDLARLPFFLHHQYLAHHRQLRLLPSISPLNFKPWIARCGARERASYRTRGRKAAGNVQNVSSRIEPHYLITLQLSDDEQEGKTNDQTEKGKTRENKSDVDIAIDSDVGSAT